MLLVLDQLAKPDNEVTRMAGGIKERRLVLAKAPRLSHDGRVCRVVRLEPPRPRHLVPGRHTAGRGASQARLDLHWIAGESYGLQPCPQVIR